MRTGVMVSSNQRWPRLFTILFILAVQMARTSAFCCESACALMRTEGNCTQTDPNDQCKVEDYGECKCIWITTTLSESSKQCLAEKLLPKGSNIQISMSVLVVVIPIIGSCCLCCCGCYCFFKWLGKGEDEDEEEDERRERSARGGERGSASPSDVVSWPWKRRRADDTDGHGTESADHVSSSSRDTSLEPKDEVDEAEGDGQWLAWVDQFSVLAS
mmetsp:Transcript_57207/g.134253  ORF Transcript_57207/g.134253 Transcript_57207/m.134253 type:complete len:216 (-) Transcript_57207:46-693(-)